MARDLTASVQTELGKQAVYIFHLIELQFDSGTMRFTDLPRSIVYNSNTWTASADFLTFGAVKESEALEVGTVEFVVSSVDLSVMAQALLEDFIDRPVLLYRGMIDPTTYALIPDPILMYEGRITSFKVQENVSSGKSSLTWQTASAWADFNRTNGRRTNPNDQEIYYPGDKGFEFAHQINFNLNWGRT